MSIIADLIRAGVDPELVARVADELEAAANRLRPKTFVTPDFVVLPPRVQQTLDIYEPVFKRDGFRCVYCGGGKLGAGNSADRLEVDHVIPLSRGGTDDPDNLVTACKSCNASKKDLLLSEWRGGIYVR